MGTNNLGFDDAFMATMLGDFLDESQGYLTQLNEKLLVLDELVRAAEGTPPDVDIEMLNEMFRAAHSLKGLSAMLQLNDINSLTHKIESVFDAARHGELTIGCRTVDVMFTAFDRLTSMVDMLKDPNIDEVEYEGVLQELQNELDSAGANREAATGAEIDAALSQTEATETPSMPASTQSVEQSSPPPPALKQPTPMDTRTPFDGLEDEAEIVDRYLAIFIDECDESLDSLAESLLTESGEIPVDHLLVICHRIKGAAASIGLNRVARLSHSMEDLLQELREAGIPVSESIADALLQSTDSLRAYVQGLRAGIRPEDNFRDSYLSLRSAARSALSDAATASEPEVKEDAAPQRPDGLTDEDRAKVSAAATVGDPRAVVILLTFEEGLPLVGLKAHMVYERLSSLGEVFLCEPAESELEEMSELGSLLLGLTTDHDYGALQAKANLEGVKQFDVEHLFGSPQPVASEPEVAAPAETVAEPQSTAPAAAPVATPAPPAKAANSAPPRSTEKPTETLRVDIERLDQLMNLAGQLVINKARFGQIGDKLKGLSSRKHSIHSLANISGALDRIVGEADDYTRSPAKHVSMVQSLRSHVQQIRDDLEVIRGDLAQLTEARVLVNDLSEAVHQLDRVSDGIQKSVMDTRMVPIGPLFGRFKRVIRDITRDNGKDIQLVIRGEKTELDKRMIDELGDPLIHMVRNAADHGVESPEERVAAGKPARGTVSLDAFHRGNRIFIQVKDDGRGLSPDKIRAKAISKGIITQQDAERLSLPQVYALIWEPGFSTAEQVTQVSGRGMGMDIVRSKIEQLSGTLELDSEVGKGTTITIELPLTMAILPSLLTVIGGNVFAIPVESVVEIVRVQGKDMASVRGLKTARVRGRVISVVQLAELFQWAELPFAGDQTTGDSTLVVMGTDGNELGLAVDSLLGEEDVVIKSLAENYRNLPGLAGASILGDGRVSLILDVSALVGMACRMPTSTETEPKRAATEPALV